MFWDYSYILVIIGAVICAIASLNVRITYSKYNKVMSSKGLTAQEVAQMILHDAGIYDVRIEPVGGNLSDHYSPNEKVLRLSESVYNKTSVAAIGVAAHECGHAIQHQEGYGPLKMRSASVPLARIGSYASWPLIIIGLLLSAEWLAQIGVIFFAFVVFFQMITLPVEFNASKRAIAILDSNGVLAGEELSGAKSVLRAAAMTYVAALFSSIMQLLRLLMIISGRRRN